MMLISIKFYNIKRMRVLELLKSQRIHDEGDEEEEEEVEEEEKELVQKKESSPF